MAPIATCSVYEQERLKYARVWQEVEAYRITSFGEQLVGPFLALSGVQPGARIVDVGCGTGRAGLKFAELLMAVVLVDATRDALDRSVAAEVERYRIGFVESCLWREWGLEPQDWAYCCDVLEHIPTEFTMLVVARCLQAAPRAFFHINFEPDSFGRAIGDVLHLTVQPFVWWRDRLAEVGRLVEARDLLGTGLFILERA